MRSAVFSKSFLTDVVFARSRLSVFLMALAALPVAAFGQIDLAGEWASTFHEDLPHRGGMRLGDYTGLPFNEAGWRKGHSWDESARSTFERQCIPHVATYALRGPATIRFLKDVDPINGFVRAYQLHGSYGRPRTIWMDGRDHPSDLAPHTWGGFSTGRWERNTLVVETSHIKVGWLQRNGAPTSDMATMEEHFSRYGSYLLVVTIINDPVYLDEPFIRTSNYALSLPTAANSWGHCGPAQVVDELGGRPQGDVPHFLPGDTREVEAFLNDAGVPAEPARGGGETIYPEYMEKIANGDLDNRLFPPITPGVTFARVAPPASTASGGGIRILPVQGNVYLLAGAGGNMAVQVGDDGVVLVDTGDGKVTDQVIAAIRTLSDKPIRFILNTHAHLDHVGGNAVLGEAGDLGAGGRANDDTGALILAHEAVLEAVSAPTGEEPAIPFEGWPTEGYPGATKEVFQNGEGIEMIHVPSAHTAGDSLIYFRRSDVVVAGGVYTTTTYPVIRPEDGGSMNGFVDGVNRIIAQTIPADWQEGGTMVIPGHGRISDEADVVEYRDMITIIRDRIRAMVEQGMTLEQVKAARPTLEYDARYGAETGEWTTDMFVEAAYRSLSEDR